MKSMKDQYGSKRGEQVFYASVNKGNIKGVEKMKNGGLGKRSGPPPKKGPDSQGMKLKVPGFFTGAQADTKRGQAMSPGTSSTGAPRGGGRNPSAQFSDSTPISPQARQALTKQRKTTRAEISPSTTFRVRAGATIAGALANTMLPGSGTFVSQKILSDADKNPYWRRDDIRKQKEETDLASQIGRREDTPIVCPDGSMPPCTDTTKSISVGGGNAVTPYQMNFQYRSGGIVRGSGKVLKGRVKKARVF